jgi:hypothetical protein
MPETVKAMEDEAMNSTAEIGIHGAASGRAFTNRLRVLKDGARELLTIRDDGDIQIAEDLTLEEARYVLIELAQLYVSASESSVVARG